MSRSRKEDCTNRAKVKRRGFYSKSSSKSKSIEYISRKNISECIDINAYSEGSINCTRGLKIRGGNVISPNNRIVKSFINCLVEESSNNCNYRKTTDVNAYDLKIPKRVDPEMEESIEFTSFKWLKAITEVGSVETLSGISHCSEPDKESSIRHTTLISNHRMFLHAWKDTSDNIITSGSITLLCAHGFRMFIHGFKLSTLRSNSYLSEPATIPDELITSTPVPINYMSGRACITLRTIDSTLGYASYTFSLTNISNETALSFPSSLLNYTFTSISSTIEHLQYSFDFDKNTFDTITSTCEPFLCTLDPPNYNYILFPGTTASDEDPHALEVTNNIISSTITDKGKTTTYSIEAKNPSLFLIDLMNERDGHLFFFNSFSNNFIFFINEINAFLGRHPIYSIKTCSSISKLAVFDMRLTQHAYRQRISNLRALPGQFRPSISANMQAITDTSPGIIKPSLYTPDILFGNGSIASLEVFIQPRVGFLRKTNNMEQDGNEPLLRKGLFLHVVVIMLMSLTISGAAPPDPPYPIEGVLIRQRVDPLSVSLDLWIDNTVIDMTEMFQLQSAIDVAGGALESSAGVQGVERMNRFRAVYSRLSSLYNRILNLELRSVSNENPLGEIEDIQIELLELIRMPVPFEAAGGNIDRICTVLDTLMGMRIDSADLVSLIQELRELIPYVREAYNTYPDNRRVSEEDLPVHEDIYQLEDIRNSLNELLESGNGNLGVFTFMISDIHEGLNRLLSQISGKTTYEVQLSHIFKLINQISDMDVDIGGSASNILDFLRSVLIKITWGGVEEYEAIVRTGRVDTGFRAAQVERSGPPMESRPQTEYGGMDLGGPSEAHIPIGRIGSSVGGARMIEQQISDGDTSISVPEQSLEPVDPIENVFSADLVQFLDARPNIGIQDLPIEPEVPIVDLLSDGLVGPFEEISPNSPHLPIDAASLIEEIPPNSPHLPIDAASLIEEDAIAEVVVSLDADSLTGGASLPIGLAAPLEAVVPIGAGANVLSGLNIHAAGIPVGAAGSLAVGAPVGAVGSLAVGAPVGAAGSLAVGAPVGAVGSLAVGAPVAVVSPLLVNIGSKQVSPHGPAVNPSSDLFTLPNEPAHSNNGPNIHNLMPDSQKYEHSDGQSSLHVYSRASTFGPTAVSFEFEHASKRVTFPGKIKAEEKQTDTSFASETTVRQPTPHPLAAIASTPLHTTLSPTFMPLTHKVTRFAPVPKVFAREDTTLLLKPEKSTPEQTTLVTFETSSAAFNEKILNCESGATVSPARTHSEFTTTFFLDSSTASLKSMPSSPRQATLPPELTTVPSEKAPFYDKSMTTVPIQTILPSEHFSSAPIQTIASPKSQGSTTRHTTHHQKFSVSTKESTPTSNFKYGASVPTATKDPLESNIIAEQTTHNIESQSTAQQKETTSTSEATSGKPNSPLESRSSPLHTIPPLKPGGSTLGDPPMPVEKVTFTPRRITPGPDSIISTLEQFSSTSLKPQTSASKKTISSPASESVSIEHKSPLSRSKTSHSGSDKPSFQAATSTHGLNATIYKPGKALPLNSSSTSGHGASPHFARPSSRGHIVPLRRSKTSASGREISSFQAAASTHALNATIYKPGQALPLNSSSTSGHGASPHFARPSSRGHIVPLRRYKTSASGRETSSFQAAATTHALNATIYKPGQTLPLNSSSKLGHGALPHFSRPSSKGYIVPLRRSKRSDSGRETSKFQAEKSTHSINASSYKPREALPPSLSSTSVPRTPPNFVRPFSFKHTASIIKHQTTTLDPKSTPSKANLLTNGAQMSTLESDIGSPVYKRPTYLLEQVTPQPIFQKLKISKSQSNKTPIYLPENVFISLSLIALLILICIYVLRLLHDRFCARSQRHHK